MITTQQSKKRCKKAMKTPKVEFVDEGVQVPERQLLLPMITMQERTVEAPQVELEFADDVVQVPEQGPMITKQQRTVEISQVEVVDRTATHRGIDAGGSMAASPGSVDAGGSTAASPGSVDAGGSTAASPGQQKIFEQIP